MRGGRERKEGKESSSEGHDEGKLEEMRVRRTLGRDRFEG